MGHYLNMITNTKTNPNENYAREIMQLFSIGTDLPRWTARDTARRQRRAALPTYDQSVIDNLKLVLTGWKIQSNVACDPASQQGNDLRGLPQPDDRRRRRKHDATDKVLFQGFLPNQDGVGSADQHHRRPAGCLRAQHRDRRALQSPEHRDRTSRAS